MKVIHIIEQTGQHKMLQQLERQLTDAIDSPRTTRQEVMVIFTRYKMYLRKYRAREGHTDSFLCPGGLLNEIKRKYSI